MLTHASARLINRMKWGSDNKNLSPIYFFNLTKCKSEEKMKYGLLSICKAQAMLNQATSINNGEYVYGEEIQNLSKAELIIINSLNQLLFRLFEKKNMNIILNKYSYITTINNPIGKTFFYKEADKEFKTKINTISIATPKTKISQLILMNDHRFLNLESDDSTTANKFITDNLIIPFIRNIRNKCRGLIGASPDMFQIYEYTAHDIPTAATNDAFAPVEVHKVQQSILLYKLSFKTNVVNSYYLYLSVENSVRTWEKI